MSAKSDTNLVLFGGIFIVKGIYPLTTSIGKNRHKRYSMFRAIKKWFRDLVLYTMATPPPVIKTIQQILIDLNGSTGVGDWVIIDKLVSLSTVEVGIEGVAFHPANGLILKAFWNTSTCEVRTYLARALDVSDRDKLFN